jgi:hypothetical protein
MIVRPVHACCAPHCARHALRRATRSVCVASWRRTATDTSCDGRCHVLGGMRTASASSCSAAECCNGIANAQLLAHAVARNAALHAAQPRRCARVDQRSQALESSVPVARILRQSTAAAVCRASVLLVRCEYRAVPMRYG